MEFLKQAKERVLRVELADMRAVMRRRMEITMTQLMAIPPKARPLLVRSVVEASFACMLYILFLRFAWLPSDWVTHTVNFGIVTTVTVLYLLAVFFGIRYMDARPPITFRVYEIMLVYNIYHCAINAYLAVRILWELRSDHLALMGSNYEPAEHGHTLAFLIWVFYNTKYVELLDTAFIIATKQFRAITSLHVAQKLLFIWWWFLVCRFGYRGDSYFPALTSAVLLVFLYAGYVLAILNVSFPWRNMMPRLFQVECILCLIHAVYGLYTSSLPFWVAIVELTVMLLLSILLADYHFAELKKADTNAAAAPAPALFFSFDSSGWFYLYHFGVAYFLQTRVSALSDSFGCSGASGGSLVGACLICKVDCLKMAEYVVKCREICKLNVFKLLPCVERAMEDFLPPSSAEACSNRLLILATKVLPRPPFFMGEVLSKYENVGDLKAALRASCHVPVVGGVLPHKTRFGYYYDGFFWSSGFGFVDWRSISPNDTVLRVSGMGGLGADIRPPFVLPPWWALFPPVETVLMGLFWRGYQDAEDYFTKRNATLLPRPDLGRPARVNLRTLRSSVMTAWSNFVLVVLGLAALIFVADLFYIEVNVS